MNKTKWKDRERKRERRNSEIPYDAGIIGYYQIVRLSKCHRGIVRLAIWKFDFVLWKRYGRTPVMSSCRLYVSPCLLLSCFFSICFCAFAFRLKFNVKIKDKNKISRLNNVFPNVPYEFHSPWTVPMTLIRFRGVTEINRNAILRWTKERVIAFSKDLFPITGMTIIIGTK